MASAGKILLERGQHPMGLSMVWGVGKHLDGMGRCFVAAVGALTSVKTSLRLGVGQVVVREIFGDCVKGTPLDGSLPLIGRMVCGPAVLQ